MRLFSHYTLVLPVACIALTSFSPATFAGFDMSYQGVKSSGDYSLPQYTISMENRKSLSDNAQPHDVSKVQVEDPAQNAPAFEVYQERYVPDSVKKKYGLSDDWYGQGERTTAPMPLRAEDMGTGMESAVPQPLVIVESWRGRKGETVHQILTRWSERSGAELMWASPDNPVLKEDFSFVGSYQDAVAKLMRTGGLGQLSSQYRPEGLSPVMMSPASMVEAHTETPAAEPRKLSTIDAALSQVFTPAAPERKTETRWFGLSGASLSEVLSVWGEDAGIQVIWQAERNFALKDTVTQVGSFEDAVYQALSQYDHDDVRPVGEVYRDPASGQKVLVIRTDAAS
ncbi:MAG: TcpQ domain-containing protein [Pseudobdellovibrionaceae bacterium]